MTQATAVIDGFVQPRDKIVVGFALTVYTYSSCRKEVTFLQLADAAEICSIKRISRYAGRIPSPGVISTRNEILRLL